MKIMQSIAKIDFEKPKINIVYYGSAAAGKTTNLYYIHTNLPPENKSEITVKHTDYYVHAFFDFVMPDIGYIDGSSPVFHIQWVSGSAKEWRTAWNPLLSRVDAIVFVVDSLTDRLEANQRSFERLASYFRQQGYSFEGLPWVIQYNKRDFLDAILPVYQLQKQLNQYKVPYFEAIATQGIGVFETLKMIVQLIITKTKKG